MATIRGYIAMPALADNRLNEVSKFGEFSVKVDTFSREVQIFSNDTMPGVTFKALFSENNDTHFIIPNDLGQKILTIGKWVYDQFTRKLIPRNTSKAAFIVALTTQFSEFKDFAVGELIAGAESTLNMPDYIRFASKRDGHAIQIWFSDNAIKSQYDHYETHVIPPVSDVILFNNHMSAVQTSMFNRTLADIRRVAEGIIGEDPPTYDTTYSVTWKAPDGNGTLETTWTVIGYGPMSTDEEPIKDAIKGYLTNRAPDVDWSKIFPSLYSSNEFVIVPLWNQTSPVTEKSDIGTFSPFTLVNNIKGVVNPRLPVGYSAATNLNTHLNNYLEVFGYLWRSITLTAVGSPSNKASNRKLSVIVPDLLIVPTTNGDYGRMSESTAKFNEKLTMCLELARTFGPTSVAPTSFSKRISGGRIYLSFDHDEYKIMVLTKFGFSTLI